MPTRPLAAPARSSVWLAMLVLYFVWGSTYLGIAIAVDTIPPFLMAAVRFFLAGLVLLGWSMARAGSSFALPTRGQWRDGAIVGALLLGGGMGMVAFGEQTIPSGITALLIAMMPVWVAIFGRLFYGERLPRLAVVGIVIGFVGVAIMIGPTAVGSVGALDPLGLLAVLVSPIAWSIGSLFASHRARLPNGPLMATSIQMLAGSSVLAAMAVLAGELGRFDPTTISTASAVAFLYLTIIGSLLAFTAYGWLLRVAPLPMIATYAYVNPIVAVILGALILDESIEPRTVVAGAVIITAVVLIVTVRGRMSAPRVAPTVMIRPGSSASPPEPVPSRSASG